ncbi:MAG TPA: hypothetical protein VF756_25215 [Thermoanaerobaculia bacterium]
MTSYMWDLGFNWNSVPNSDGSYELGNGLVVFPDNVPASPDQVLVNSSIGFNLFNISGATANNCSIDHLWITFSANQDGQSVTSPFNNNNFASLSSGSLTVQSPGGSTIFGPGPFPVSFAGDETAVNSGKFKFTVYLTVNGPDGSGGTTKKIFKVDPEMVIGSIG